MEIAKDIQTSILPTLKDTNEYSLGVYMRTATEVGGDYYDFYLKKEPYFGVFGDVSGHGIQSGLIMMMAEVAFNTIMKDDNARNKKITEIYQQINSTLYQNIQERLSVKSRIGSNYCYMYMTLTLFRFDKQGKFEIFGADHAEPFICRNKTGNIEVIKSSGFLMGMVEDAVGDRQGAYYHLYKGDLLVLYSDGITEAKNKSKKSLKNKGAREAMFGEVRLFEVIKKNRDKEPNDIISEVIKAVDEWMYDQEDDITITIIKRK